MLDALGPHGGAEGLGGLYAAVEWAQGKGERLRIPKPTGYSFYP